MSINNKNDAWKLWDKSGKTEFAKQLKSSIKDNSSPLFIKHDKKFGVFKIVYDMLSQTIRGQMKRDTLLTILHDIADMHPDMPSILLDIIAICDAETSIGVHQFNASTVASNVGQPSSAAATTTGSLHEHQTINNTNSSSSSNNNNNNSNIQDERIIFCQIVKELEKFLSDKLLKERLEIDTLQDVGTIKNKIFYTKFIKVKTKLYYKQRRFNLFREESEGYAKLITELNQEYMHNLSVNKTLEMIKSLIGCFNLDPNRVLDIILESFETRPEQHTLFIALLKMYMPNGSIISEVLGYKYRYFSDTRTPQSLYIITALLLQYNIMKLNDIYSWLSPNDKQLSTEWDTELNEAKEYVRKLNIISTNRDKDIAVAAAAAAAAAVSATVSSSSAGGSIGSASTAGDIPTPNSAADTIEKDDIEDENKYSANQKWNLCEALLNVGEWSTAVQLIDKLPKDSTVVKLPVAIALSSLIHNIIEPVYKLKCVIKKQQSDVVCGGATTLNGPSASVQTNLIPILNVTLGTTQIPQAFEFIDLRVYAFPMAIKLGPTLFNDPVLLYKLIRLMRAILIEMNVDASTNAPLSSNTDETALYFDILTLLDSSILPALSYMDCNCCVAEEIWSVIRLFPYHYRYSLYGRWKNDTYLIHPKLIRRRGGAQKQIKALMKRVSKENVKPVGRLIGKLSHSSPGFLFDYILLQIQIYDNLIGPVVDSLKYLTSLSYDVLGYCLIEALAQADRNRFKHDGTSLSMWLQSLANFCGAIYKKYNIELSGLLQYVGNQLKAQKSLDLLILKEVVQKMAGIEATEEMTTEQLNAMSGGELLRSEAGYFSQIRNTKKSSQRLKDALASNDLAVTLCLLMAQQKHCVIYRETAQSHLKLVGKLYDQCQDTLVQFGIFLGSTYSVDEYVERLPSIHNMLQEYHIHSDVAFFLARPMFTHQINQKYDQLRKSEPNSKKMSTIQKLDKYLEATSSIIGPIVNSVRPLHPIKIWEDISPQFLVTFWSLSMYDLQVPMDSYQKEIGKLKQLSLSVLDTKDMNASKGRKEQERYIALIDKLQDERKKQQEHVDKIMHRLNQEKDLWFLSRSAKSAKNETITQFLQLCLFPRCTFTALDAVYCAKFVHTIHNLKTSNFSTLLCYDRIFCDITYSVTSCTENEATRYGRFLCAMLETVMKWHENSATFNKECANYPGFVTKYRVSNQFSEANDLVGYENYRHVCHKWHYKITKAMVFCLDSKDYMQIRNALIILMRILPHFPMLVKLAQIIEKRVEKVREEERNHRQDLFVLASSYIGQLKGKSSEMIREVDFHQVSDKPTKESTNAAGGSSNSNSLTNASTLNNSTSPSSSVNIILTNDSVKSNGTVSSNAVTTPMTIPSTSTTTAPAAGTTTIITTTTTPPTSAGTTITIIDTITIQDKKEQISRSDKRVNIKQQSTSSSSSLSTPASHHLTAMEKDTKHENSKELRGLENDNYNNNNNNSSSNSTITSSKEKQYSSRKDDLKLDKDDIETMRSSRESRELRDKDKRHERRTPSYYDHSSSVDRFYSAGGGSGGGSGGNSSQHYDQDRDLSSVSNSSNGSTVRRSHDSPDIDRELKRRKLEMLNSKRMIDADSSLMLNMVDDIKKERSTRSKDKREKITVNIDDDGGGGGGGSFRKEKKVGRKRDRLAESSSSELKRRKDDDKLMNGGGGDDDVISSRDSKHSYHRSSREKSPYSSRSDQRDQRDRSSHDISDSRDKSYSFSSKSSRPSRTAY